MAGCSSAPGDRAGGVQSAIHHRKNMAPHLAFRVLGQICGRGLLTVTDGVKETGVPSARDH